MKAETCKTMILIMLTDSDLSITPAGLRINHLLLVRACGEKN